MSLLLFTLKPLGAYIHTVHSLKYISDSANITQVINSTSRSTSESTVQSIASRNQPYEECATPTISDRKYESQSYDLENPLDVSVELEELKSNSSQEEEDFVSTSLGISRILN